VDSKAASSNSRSPVRVGSKEAKVANKAANRVAKVVSKVAKVASKAGSRNQDKAASRVAIVSLQARTRPRVAGFFLEVAMPRQLIEPKSEKRFVRRKKTGQFKESDDVGRSLSQDRKRKAKTVAKKGEGDRGDRKKKKKR
jgi:hypothetical protein